MAEATTMASAAGDTGAPVQLLAKRPLSVTILGGFSLLLGVVTGIPQLYYDDYRHRNHRHASKRARL